MWHAPRVRRAILSVGLLALAVVAAIGWIYVTTNVDAGGGRGWRLLTAAPHFAPDRFGERPETRAELVMDHDDLSAIWREIHLSEPAPDVDLAQSVVFWAVAIGGGSCPNHLDGVEIGDEVVISATHGFAAACTSDAVPYTYLIAVDRDALPAPPFKVRVVTDESEGSTQVDQLPG